MGPCGKRRLAVLGACALWLAASCGDEDGTGGDAAGDLVLTAAPESLLVAPGERNEIAFRLQDRSGRVRAGRLVNLALLKPDPVATPAQDTGGATLLASQGTTDASGMVVAAFRAGGLGAFRVQASHGRHTGVTVPVVVAEVATRKAQAVAVSEAGLSPASLEMRLYPGGDCRQLSVTSPPPQDPAYLRKLPITEGWTLPPLEAEGMYALTARGLDQSGLAIAFGCIPVDGRALLQSVPVTLSLPLRRVPPNLVGRFQLASELAFSPELAQGAKATVEAWSRFSLCPHDPASLWLDCTLDALAQSPDDPLDCKPAADEGIVGQLLTARLGLPTGAGSACRGDADLGGEVSLDALAAALFEPSSGAPEVTALLPKITSEMAGLFARIRVSSTLEFAESGRANALQATHALLGLGFPVGEAFQNVSLLDRPGRFARAIRASLDEGGQRVELPMHGFGLRLGQAARTAFVTRALGERGLPTEESAFVSTVFAHARLANEGMLHTGCDALDLLVCRDLGRSPGCILEACQTGLTIFATRLRAGFDALDGEDLEFFLAGDAALADRSEDGTVRSLGSLVANGEGPGLWSGELRTRVGTTAMSGLWVGARAPGM